MMLLVLKSPVQKIYYVAKFDVYHGPQGREHTEAYTHAAAPVEYLFTQSVRYQSYFARFRIYGKKRGIKPDAGNYHTEAIGADNPHTVLPADVGYLALQGPSVGPRLRETSREDNHAAHIGTAAFIDYGRNGMRGSDNNGEVDR